MKKLEIEHVQRIYGLYLGAKMYVNQPKAIGFKSYIGDLTPSNLYAWTNRYEDCFDNKLILTSIADAPDEVILSVCKVANEQGFGDYRYNKWIVTKCIMEKGDVIILPPDSDLEPEFLEVRNEKAEVFFDINCRNGVITLYNKDNESVADNWGDEINPTYYLEWFKNYIIVPISPWNKTAIELGLAIKNNKNEKVLCSS